MAVEEIEDAVDVAGCLVSMLGEQLPVFQQMLQDVCATRHPEEGKHGPGIQDVPKPPDEGNTAQFSLRHGC